MSQKTGLNRNTIDKFYTSEETVNLCITYIEKNLKINKTDLCIEPSAGNGAFINKIKLLSDNFVFYDIQPEHDEIKKLDYLIDNLSSYERNIKYNKIHVIGNPPFGRQSSLAIKFIKKSANFCDSISFILPKSFKKDSLKSHFPLNFHLIFENDLPKNSFILYNINETVKYDVPCVFQIWIKRDYQREIPQKLIPYKFKFVKKVKIPISLLDALEYMQAK